MKHLQLSLSLPAPFSPQPAEPSAGPRAFPWGELPRTFSLFPAPSWSFRFVHAGSEALQIHLGSHDVTHLFLQLVNGKPAVQHHETLAAHHLLVLLQNPRLQHPQTFRAAVRHSPSHPRSVVFE